MDIELKHCPFCGGDADLLEVEPNGSYWYIACVECEAEIRRYYLMHNSPARREVDRNKARNELIKVWNKRFRGRKK